MVNVIISLNTETGISQPVSFALALIPYVGGLKNAYMYLDRIAERGSTLVELNPGGESLTYIIDKLEPYGVKIEL